MSNENMFKNQLKEACSEHKINLNDNQLEQFETYKNLLIQWNEKMNLTAIVDEYEIIIKHFVDCLEIMKYIDLNKSKEIINIIDVGTGAGFPGLVICIYFEGEVNITLLDSLNKRLIFLEEVIKQLDLKNVKIVHKRAEDGANDIIYREKFDYVVSRAVAGLNILLEYTIPYLKKQGSGLYLKGDKINEEIRMSDKALKTLKSKISNEYKYLLEINDEIYNRTILEVEKYEITNLKYPRSYGKIKKAPL